MSSMFFSRTVNSRQNAPRVFISASVLTQVITAETNLCEGDGFDGDFLSLPAAYPPSLPSHRAAIWTYVIALYVLHHNEP